MRVQKLPVWLRPYVISLSRLELIVLGLFVALLSVYVWDIAQQGQQTASNPSVKSSTS